MVLILSNEKGLVPSSIISDFPQWSYFLQLLGLLLSAGHLPVCPEHSAQCPGCDLPLSGSHAAGAIILLTDLRTKLVFFSLLATPQYQWLIPSLWPSMFQWFIFVIALSIFALNSFSGFLFICSFGCFLSLLLYFLCKLKCNCSQFSPREAKEICNSSSAWKLWP